jgi:iron(II)-dependent oxidoreductase
MHMRLTWVLLWIGISPAVAAETVLVPAGAFVMGCSRGDSQCEGDEKPAATVTVPAFRIDTKEVTVAEYRACVQAGKCQPPKTHARNQYCNYDAPGRDTHPVNCIDWADAFNYCKVEGRRLPREAEWEKAARAGRATRYSWGDSATCAQAIANDGKTTGSAKGELDGCGEDRTWPVASRPSNALGIYDMHGNVGEWVSNGYAANALTHYAKGELDYPPQSQGRVLRGGSWDEKAVNLRASFRNSRPPASGDAVWGSIGFRCAQDAPQSR